MYTIEQIKHFIESFINFDNIEYCGSGDDSEAYCVNNNIVVKFPKNNIANKCIQNEIIILNELQNKFELEIPNVLFNGTFLIKNKEYTFFGSKKLNGINLSKNDFLNLGEKKLKNNAKILANFLRTLHSIKNIKNNVLLHNDLSLNHILFKDGNIIGILDFADSKYGKYEKDFKYLMDNNDPEEFGKSFGEMVLRYYLNIK